MLIYAVFAALALIPALLGFEPRMKPGTQGWNFIFHIEMFPRSEATRESWGPVLAQELTEWLFCRLVSVLLGALVAAWLGPIFGIGSVFVFYVIVRQSTPGYRLCEYIGKAAEILQGRREGTQRYADERYTANWLIGHYPKYFGDRSIAQVEAGLRRAMPLSRLLLGLIRRRFRRLAA